MKSSERLLLTSFLVLLLLGGAFILWDLYRDRKDLLVAERAQLELDLVEIETLLEDEEMWTARAAMLAESQPAFTTRADIDNAIFEDAQSGEAANVTTSEIKLIEAVTTPQYVQAGVTLKAEGTLEDVFRWLHQLQSPDTFRVVRRFKAVPHPEEDEEIQCDLELLRWYAPPRDAVAGR
jgi:hypothetical protein